MEEITAFKLIVRCSEERMSQYGFEWCGGSGKKGQGSWHNVGLEGSLNKNE